MHFSAATSLHVTVHRQRYCCEEVEVHGAASSARISLPSYRCHYIEVRATWRLLWESHRRVGVSLRWGQEARCLQAEEGCVAARRWYASLTLDVTDSIPVVGSK